MTDERSRAPVPTPGVTIGQADNTSNSSGFASGSGYGSPSRSGSAIGSGSSASSGGSGGKRRPNSATVSNAKQATRSARAKPHHIASLEVRNNRRERATNGEVKSTERQRRAVDADAAARGSPVRVLDTHIDTRAALEEKADQAMPFIERAVPTAVSDAVADIETSAVAAARAAVASTDDMPKISSQEQLPAASLVELQLATERGIRVVVFEQDSSPHVILNTWMDALQEETTALFLTMQSDMARGEERFMALREQLVLDSQHTKEMDANDVLDRETKAQNVDDARLTRKIAELEAANQQLKSEWTERFTGMESELRQARSTVSRLNTSLRVESSCRVILQSTRQEFQQYVLARQQHLVQERQHLVEAHRRRLQAFSKFVTAVAAAVDEEKKASVEQEWNTLRPHIRDAHMEEMAEKEELWQNETHFMFRAFELLMLYVEKQSVGRQRHTEAVSALEMEQNNELSALMSSSSSTATRQKSELKTQSAFKRAWLGVASAVANEPANEAADSPRDHSSVADSGQSDATNVPIDTLTWHRTTKAKVDQLKLIHQREHEDLMRELEQEEETLLQWWKKRHVRLIVERHKTLRQMKKRHKRQRRRQEAAATRELQNVRRLAMQDEQVRMAALRRQAVMDALLDPCIVADPAGTIVFFNRAACEMFGREAEEVIGDNIRILCEPEVAAKHDSYLERYAQTREARIINTSRNVTAMHKDGTRIPIRLSVSESTLAARGLFIACVHDRREEIARDARLGSRQRQIQSIMNAMLDPVVVSDKSGTILVCNAAATRLFGFADDELIGSNVRVLCHPTIRSTHDTFIQNYLSTGKKKVIGTNGRRVIGRTKEGKDIDLLLSLSEANANTEEHLFLAGFRRV